MLSELVFSPFTYIWQETPEWVLSKFKRLWKYHTHHSADNDAVHYTIVFPFWWKGKFWERTEISVKRRCNQSMEHYIHSVWIWYLEAMMYVPMDPESYTRKKRDTRKKENDHFWQENIEWISNVGCLGEHVTELIGVGPRIKRSGVRSHCWFRG